uniref:Uroporphyrinogen III synthase n=1 Tax=Paramoeba invadens TaxID=1321612 RepID=A0A167HCV6_9EUKA|nr:uroporphyrinogen III synthase [Paramoeba invadens]
MNCPVVGKKVVVTAPMTYAPRLAKEIEGKGGEALLLPTIETKLIEAGDPAWEEMISSVKAIQDYDWILFTSRNGIKGVMSALLHIFQTEKGGKGEGEEKGKGGGGLGKEEEVYLKGVFEGKGIAAIGKDAELLESYGLKATLIPPTPSPQGIVDSLNDMYTKEGEGEKQEKKEIKEVKCLVPAPIVREIPEPDVIPKFIAAINELGCQWTRFGCYVTSPTPSLTSHKNLELLKNGEVDMVAFSSTAEIIALLGEMTTEELKEKTKVGCFGPITAGNAEKNGVRVDMVAKDFSSFRGFAEEMERFFSN